MRIFPKSRFAEDVSLNPQNVLAGLFVAVKGHPANEVEVMHLCSNLAGPQSDNFMVNPNDLRQLVQSSERILNNLGLSAFIEQANLLLTERQKLAALVTIMDVCMVENSLLDGEKHVFEEIRQGFGITEDELRPFEEMLILKNESSIRLNVMPSSYNRAAEGFRSLV